MKNRSGIKFFTGILILILAGIFTGSADCQEINLDKMKKVGDLVCYQSLKDLTIWYYLPDQPRLAMKNGKPQFSFMKYSRTQKTGKAGTNVAQGGGIVHFLVTYGTSKDRVAAAQRRLEEQQPDARIEGPIVYRKGSFALITSFQQDQQTLVRTVAVGKAPLMEGQKAAVSMALSREGAELLWESFKGDTPDISLVFDMEFVGVREPYEATIEADWARVSKHKRLKAGMKYSWFGADVDMLFQELRQDGAIKITTKGENASMDRIVESANAKLLQVMFDPAPVDDLSRAAAEKDSYSSLNQAMKMLKEDRAADKKPATKKATSLNLNSPGFSQLIAAVLDIMISDAHAADNSSSVVQTSDIKALPPLPEDEDDGSVKLTTEQKDKLRQLLVQGQNFYRGEQYQATIDSFKEFNQNYLDFKGKPSGEILFNIGVCYMKLSQYEQASNTFRHAAAVFGDHTKDGQDCVKKAEEAERHINAGTELGNQGSTVEVQKNSDPKPQAAVTSASDAYNNARRLDEAAKQAGYTQKVTREAIDAYDAYVNTYSPTGSRAKEIEGRLRSLNSRLEEAKQEEALRAGVSGSDNKLTESKALAPVPSGTASGSSAASAGAATGAAAGAETKMPVPPPVPTSSTSAAKTSTASAAAAKKPSVSNAVKKAAAKKPSFSLVASYQMKNIKRSGKMVYQMNHFRSETQGFTMTENIGSLYRRYGNDSRIFKAVTIDDAVFKQREILVTLDGQDTATFTKYMNFVTVKMEKNHQSGETTNDEVVITPEIFNQSNNSFSLNYGYKGDTNRDQWLDYQYQVIWSFHGGFEIRSEWNKANSPMLALYPPYRYRGLTIEGEGEQLQAAKVRHAVITVNSQIEGKQITTQATIKNQGPAPALHLDIPEGLNGQPGEVSIIWFLKGGKKVTSSPQKLEGDIIYWDELPEGGRI